MGSFPKPKLIHSYGKMSAYKKLSTCVHEIFPESPLNTDTMACPLGVCINLVILYN